MTNLITCVIKQLFNPEGWKPLYEKHQSDKNVSVVYSNCNLQIIPHAKNALWKRETIYSTVHGTNGAHLIDERSRCITTHFCCLTPTPSTHIHTPLASPFRHSLVAHLNTVLHWASASPTKTQRNKSHQGGQHFILHFSSPQFLLLTLQATKSKKSTVMKKHIICLYKGHVW